MAQTMDKRFVLIGIVLILFSFLLFSAVISPTISSQQNFNNSFINKIIVAPNSIVSTNIVLTNSSVLIAKYLSTIPINFYFINSTAKYFFNNSTTLKNGNISNIEGKGLYLGIINGSYGTTYPYNANLSNMGYNTTVSTQGYKKPFYEYNQNISQLNSIYYQKGTYYLEFYNDNTTYANVTYIYDLYPLSYLINSTNQSVLNTAFVPESLVGSLIFLVGIILTVFGLLKKNENIKEKEKINKEITELYDKIEQKTTKRSKKQTKSKKHKLKKKKQSNN